jgi:hypothetical protein
MQLFLYANIFLQSENIRVEMDCFELRNAKQINRTAAVQGWNFVGILRFEVHITE